MTPIDTEVALSFFLLLTLGHFVGDFVLQPYWLVLAKRSGWRGLFIHVGVVTFVTAILLWGRIPNWWVWIIVLFLFYYNTDWFSKLIVKKPGIEPKDGLGFGDEYVELPPDTERVQFIEIDN